MFLARSALIFASSDGPGSAFSPRRHKGWVGRARRPSLTRASPTHIVDGTYPRRARYSFPPRRPRGVFADAISAFVRGPAGFRAERGANPDGEDDASAEAPGRATRRDDAIDDVRRRPRGTTTTRARARRAVPRVDVAAGASSPTGATGLAFVADARPNPNRRRRDRTPRSRRRDPRRDATRTRGPPTRARGTTRAAPASPRPAVPRVASRSASPTASFSGRLGLGSPTLERPFAIARVFSTPRAPIAHDAPPIPLVPQKL